MLLFRTEPTGSDEVSEAPPGGPKQHRRRLRFLSPGTSHRSTREVSLARVSSRASDDHPRKSDPNPTTPLVFPRSVSPYVSRQKSDYASWQSCDRHNNLFYSTPQLGRAFGTRNSEANSGFHGRTSSSLKKKTGRFWIFTSLFRSRSNKLEANPRISSQEPCEPSSSGSPSWFSMIFPARRKNMDRMNSLEDSTTTGLERRRTGGLLLWLINI